MISGWDQLTPLILTVITASTPLLFAAAGELITERAGVLNLGVEGLMVVGALAAFAGTHTTGSAIAGVLLAALAGMTLALVFSILTLTLLANQVATGLALTIFGLGLTSLLGSGYVGVTVENLPTLHIPGLSDLPFIGPVLFGQDYMVYLSFLVVGGIYWVLARTRIGLVLRAVGASHDSAHALGYPVIRIRYMATMFGGALGGIAGSYLSLIYTPMWAENLTAGRGWIALALVVFSTWRPGRLVLGAYLFGAITVIQLHAQGLGVAIPSQFLSMTPYLATILVLVVISRDKLKIRLNAPACLGLGFRPTQ